MYIDLLKLREENIKSLSTLPDERLISLIADVSREIEEYCKTKFLPTIAEQITDYNGYITLKNQPVISVESVVVSGVEYQENIDFYSYIEEGFINMITVPGILKKSVRIIYTFGYEVLPATVKSVLIDLIKYTVENRATDATMDSEDFAGEYNYKKSSNKTLRQDILKRLDAYVQVAETPASSKRESVTARLL